jgi:ubiquinone/menaquinone biosynthesis C-methylase UbiE
VQIHPGDAVLDLACGTGLATRRAAELAGPTGRVIGLDLNRGMLDMARAHAPPTGARIEWHEGSALELPFTDGELQAIVCQQGVQFFPDLAQAAREMARVAAPGARVAVSFWASLDDQSYLQAQIAALRRAIGDAVSPLIGAFRLDPAQACETIAAAGFQNVASEKVVAVVSLPPLEEFAAGQVGSLPVAPAFAALNEEQRTLYVRDMEHALSSYRTAEGRYECPFDSWIVTASKSLALKSSQGTWRLPFRDTPRTSAKFSPFPRFAATGSSSTGSSQNSPPSSPTSQTSASMAQAFISCCFGPSMTPSPDPSWVATMSSSPALMQSWLRLWRAFTRQARRTGCGRSSPSGSPSSLWLALRTG